ncbi:MAG: hypothetical protein E3K37_01450 [Candidatus Kuenenia sp.]|nr:hypothetical protein [Candidatus Kuenenia hertensis]
MKTNRIAKYLEQPKQVEYRLESFSLADLLEAIKQCYICEVKKIPNLIEKSNCVKQNKIIAVIAAIENLERCIQILKDGNTN